MYARAIFHNVTEQLTTARNGYLICTARENVLCGSEREKTSGKTFFLVQAKYY